MPMNFVFGHMRTSHSAVYVLVGYVSNMQHNTFIGIIELVFKI